MAEVAMGAEKFPLPVGYTTHRLADQFGLVDEAIAMASMYTANHMDVKAIIALTESGSTTRWDVSHSLGHSYLRIYTPC